MFVEQRSITQGQFNGLSIGMDRAQTLAVVKKLGVHVISPTPCDLFRISKANAAELPSLRGVDGVRITDRQSHFMDIYLSGGRVSKIAQTPESDIIASTSVGNDENVVRDKILKNLESQDGLLVVPIVEYNDHGSLPNDNVSSANPLDLESHNCWLFEVTSVSPAGATYEIQFGTAGLQGILYRRRKIRTE